MSPMPPTSYSLTASMRANPVATAALAVAAVGIATILGALFFEHVVGERPCPLCLTQREVWYGAIVLALLVAAAARWASPAIARIGLGVLLLVMLGGVGLAFYHAGVEWHFWAGPQDCSGPLDNLASGNLLKRLETISLVRCDEAGFRFLGLSLAGWNGLILLALAAVAGWGMVASKRA